MDAVEDRLMAIVQREFNVDGDVVTASSRLADLGDSLDQVALLCAIEEDFDITISREQGNSLTTVSDVLSLLKEPVRG